ncbi:MAG: hypothetical protein WBK55_05605 [Alphaproteobacteria bacterium]
MDEEHATETTTERAPEKGTLGKWIGRIFKILFCVIAVLLVIFTVMANIGGSNDALKKSIEGYIAESTGMDARVGQLHNMTFFPDISFDFEDTEIYPRGSADSVMNVGRVQVAFSFWDVMAGTGKIKAMNIEDFRALPGTLIKSDMQIHRISIVEDAEGARMQSTGEIGGKPFTASSNMEVFGLGRGKKYSFGPERIISASLGDAAITGTMSGGKGDNIVLKGIEIKSADKKVLNGELTLARGGSKIFVTGMLKMEPNGSDIAPEIGFYLHPGTDGTHGLEGALKSSRFDVSDFAASSPYGNLMKTVEGAFGAEDIARSFPVTLDVKSLYKNGADAGAYNGPLPLKGWHIDAGALSGSP